jgi:hypothetical protein
MSRNSNSWRVKMRAKARMVFLALIPFVATCLFSCERKEEVEIVSIMPGSPADHKGPYRY